MDTAAPTANINRRNPPATTNANGDCEAIMAPPLVVLLVMAWSVPFTYGVVGTAVRSEQTKMDRINTMTQT